MIETVLFFQLFLVRHKKTEIEQNRYYTDYTSNFGHLNEFLFPFERYPFEKSTRNGNETGPD